MIKYSEKIASELLERIACGETLVQIERDEDMPARRTVMKWKRNPKLMVGDQTFPEAYREAKRDQADHYAELINTDALELDKRLDGTRNDNTIVQAMRLKIDALKWTASKLNPMAYGEKLQHSNDPENPVTINLIDYSKVVATIPRAVNRTLEHLPEEKDDPNSDTPQLRAETI